MVLLAGSLAAQRNTGELCLKVADPSGSKGADYGSGLPFGFGGAPAEAPEQLSATG